MSRYAVGLSYHGAAYHGWQRQADLPTVQGEIEAALSRVADHPVSISVAGRTDAGVHASGQVIAFDSVSNRTVADWLRAGNGLTSDAIRFNWVQPVSADFHPRYSAAARRYVYLYSDISRDQRAAPDPHLSGLTWGTPDLDPDRMHREGQALLGEHDFTSFRAAGCQSLTPLRRVNRLSVSRQGPFVVFEIEANAFLLHMVRNIASALKDIGSDPTRPDGEIASLLAAKDRRQVGKTAPPQGLYLASVSYPDFDLPEDRAPGLIQDF